MDLEPLYFTNYVIKVSTHEKHNWCSLLRNKSSHNVYLGFFSFFNKNNTIMPIYLFIEIKAHKSLKIMKTKTAKTPISLLQTYSLTTRNFGRSLTSWAGKVAQKSAFAGNQLKS